MLEPESTIIRFTVCFPGASSRIITLHPDGSCRHTNVIGTNPCFLAGTDHLFSITVMAKLSHHSHVCAQPCHLHRLIGAFSSRRLREGSPQNRLPSLGKLQW